MAERANIGVWMFLAGLVFVCGLVLLAGWVV